MNIKTISAALFIIFFIVIFAAARARGAEKTSPLTIKWEKTEGCEKYQVQIMNSQGAIVLDRTVAATQIEFVLPVGMYKIRIAAINIFDKISFWSEWDTFEIRQAAKLAFFTNDYVEGVGLKVSGGMTYVMILPPWKQLYKNTYNSYRCLLGFYLGNSKFVKTSAFGRLIGIEMEGTYTEYKDKSNFMISSSLKNYSGGLNLCLKSNFKIPLNLYFSLGGGISYSEQRYTKYYMLDAFPTRGLIKTMDPYGKATCGIEINLFYALSLNIGADYYAIFYQDKIHMSLRYGVSVGVRI